VSRCGQAAQPAAPFFPHLNGEGVAELLPGAGDPAAGRREDPAAPATGTVRRCRATHVLLPSWTVPWRADAAGVIAAAAVASALHGAGTARIGAQLGVPDATARGWLPSLRSRVGQLRQEPMAELGRITAGCDPALPEPSGSALGDALSAVAACAHAAITMHGDCRRLGAAA
jgi:hypothetical protein